MASLIFAKKGSQFILASKIELQEKLHSSH